MTWGPWIEHDGRGRPVAACAVVEARMARDGEVIGPMQAGEIDWTHASDPVRAYRVRRDPSAERQVEALREIARDPEREREPA